MMGLNWTEKGRVQVVQLLQLGQNAMNKVRLSQYSVIGGSEFIEL